jgi:hypothetical protein
MTKKFNGIFRAWMRHQTVDHRPPIIWGHCIVHLSNPEFSGNVLHTSRILEITEHAGFKIAETRNNFYALLGPELSLPTNAPKDPMTFIMEHVDRVDPLDPYRSAAMNAEHDCPKCSGSGVYRFRSDRLAICDRCCKHNQGWWLLEEAYGADNGRWACRAGCGVLVDAPPMALEFLPRAYSGLEPSLLEDSL